MDRPTPVQTNQIDRPGPSSAAPTPTSRIHNMPIHYGRSRNGLKDETRTTNCSQETKRLESGAGSARDGEKFLSRSTAADDRNHKRSQLAENSGVSGETTAQDDSRGVPNAQKEAVKQVRPRLHGGQDYCTKKPPNHSNQPST